VCQEPKLSIQKPQNKYLKNFFVNHTVINVSSSSKNWDSQGMTNKINAFSTSRQPQAQPRSFVPDFHFRIFLVVTASTDNNDKNKQQQK